MGFHIIRKLYFVPVACFIAAAIQSCHNNDGSAIIKGNIQFPPAEKIYFCSFADSSDIFLENKSAMDSAVIDKNGNYEFKLLLKNSCAFDLVCGKKTLATNLFISPGDKIKIVFSGKENTVHVISQGTAARYNSYLVQFLDSFYRSPSVKDEYYISTNYMDLQQFIGYCEKRKQKQLGFFAQYFGGDSVKKEFRDYALNTIHYGIAVDRLMYVWKKRMKGENIIVDSSYYNFITSEFLENKDAFASPAYMRFLNLYVKDIYERMVERGELPRDKTTPMNPVIEKYKLAQHLLRKPFSEAVVYNLAYNDMHDVTGNSDVNPQIRIEPDTLLLLFQRKYSLD